MENPMKLKPRDLIFSEYESGWYIEAPDYSRPLEDCVYKELAGPFKTEALARAYARDARAFARRYLRP